MPDKRTARRSQLLIPFCAFCAFAGLALWTMDMIITRHQHHGIIGVLSTPVLACLVLFNLWSLSRKR